MKHIYLLLLVAGLALAINSCSSDSSVTPPDPNAGISNPITKDTISGNVRGTLLKSKTYYIKDSITVLAKDSLVLQEGVTVYALKPGTTVFVQGVLISNGTKANPNFFTVLPVKQTGASGKGAWGGILCDSPTVAEFHFTHVDYTGGPDASGSPRQVIRFNSGAGNRSKLVFEDSWVAYASDDGLKVYGGFGDIMRNTFESDGTTDGDCINIKTGWQGDIAYNVVWQPAGSCIKIESGGSTYFGRPTNANVYNNTVYGSGFRRLSEMGFGTLIDAGAQAKYFNNIIVNCRGGLEIGTDADTVNVKYGNNLFYATVDSLKGAAKAYFSDAVGKKQATDQVDTDPKFTNLDMTGTDYISAATNKNDFHLKSGSPAIGHGLTNGFGTGKGDVDMGAYTTSATTNQH